MGQRISNINIPVLGTGAVIREITELYLCALERGISPKDFKVPFFSGPPGVGKTQAAEQIRVNLERETGKQVVLHTIELQFSTPVDLKGMPVADLGSRSAVWLIPVEFQLDPSPDVINMVFFDELTDSLPSVLAAAKSVVLERRVADHILPDNTIVLAAGNRSEDLATVSKLPGPLANRFLHFQFSADYPQWEAWAKTHDVHPAVLGFLHNSPEKLTSPITHDAYATPRTWVDVSDILHIMRSTPDRQMVKIGAAVGVGLAAELAAWYRCCQDLPAVEEIRSGRATPRSSLTPDQSYFLVSGMAAAAKDGNANQLRNLVDFALKSFNREYQVLFFTMLLEREQKTRLMKVDLFLRWLQQNKQYLNMT